MDSSTSQPGSSLAEARALPEATLPPAWYSDERVYRAELDVIFGRAWQLAMPVAALPEGGSFAPATLAGTQVLVTRTRDGAINAFINACRHRGFPVATGPGAGNTIRCRYHAWTYDLAGNLKGAPRAEREPCFPSDELSLLPVAAHVWRDLVFVNLSDAPAPFSTAYPGLEALASERRLDLADFEYFTTASVSVQANWKAWCENLNECYHCSTIHSRTFGDAWDVHSDNYEWVCDETIIGQFAVANRRAHYVQHATGEMANVFIWPTTAVSTDEYVGVAANVTPKGPHQTQVTSHAFVRKGAKASVVREWFEMYKATLEEDVETVTLQHSALQTPNFVSGALMPNAEPGVAHFQRLVRAALANALEV